jgi:hypothetical protein
MPRATGREVNQGSLVLSHSSTILSVVFRQVR